MATHKHEPHCANHRRTNQITQTRTPNTLGILRVTVNLMMAMNWPKHVVAY